MLFILVLCFISIHSQTIKQLNEISIKEELPIGSIVTFLTDKIPNLEQSLEYDLVTPLSSELDLFSIDHIRHSLNTKNRLDYEQICSTKKSSHSCVISISIAVSNHDTIDVYLLPIEIENIDDNPMIFPLNRTVIEIEENDEYWSTKSYPLPAAIDLDGDSISYSLYFQNWTKPNGFFELDQHNLSLKPRKKFDREEQNLYSLRLVAHQQHQKDLSIDILVIIKDQNDNPPKCPSNPMLFSIDSISTTFSINATDLDEGDNAKLEYHFLNPLPGFTIDHNQGQITFDSKNWIRTNQSKLFIKIIDHGKPSRLSTECTVELQFIFLYDIQFQSNNLIHIENLNSSIGQLRILDQQTKKSSINCAIRITTSHENIFSLNEITRDLYLNLNSTILIRILSNYLISHENLSITMQIDVYDRINPSIISSRNYSLNLYFNKEKISNHSKIFFLRINEQFRLNENISLFNKYHHHCLKDQSKTWKLIDPTDTFTINQKLQLTIKKYLNTKQRDYYQIFLKDNQTNQVNNSNIIFFFILSFHLDYSTMFY